ncbi:MAG: SagB/ThcOx family dehydrogenase [Cyanobacteria bacterium P01_D01_bin.105]
MASIAQHYHQRTKYAPETMAKMVQKSGQGGLDWATQPLPYKDYKLGYEIDLKPYLEKEPSQIDNHWRWWQRLSRLLIDSYGLTAKVMTFSGKPMYLRSAPSAGGLYPAELYIVSRGTSLLDAGLYNYQVRTHSLWRFWDDHPWPDLQASCFWHPALTTTQLALVVSTVFERSAWRYKDRAYRRVFLDSGHLLGNLEVAGTLCDYRPHLIGGFADELVNKLLYLDGEHESAIALLALADLFQVEQNLPAARCALPSPTYTNISTVPDGELLGYLHENSAIAPDAGFGQREQAKQDEPVPEQPLSQPCDQSLNQVEPEQLSPDQLEEETKEVKQSKPLADKYNFPFGITVSTKTQPIQWGDRLQKLEDTILTRRSTRHYINAPITRADLFALLDFSYHPDHYRLQGFDSTPDYFDLSLIETFVAISNVEALESGCYYYAPQAQELRQIRFNQFHEDLHFLCLGQKLGRDAGAVIFHTANLTAAVEKYGERAYRYLHMDAGHLGQRLNLAATRRDLGVSGIAGFFDDQVNELLNIPEEEAVLYITTVGRKPLR